MTAEVISIDKHKSGNDFWNAHLEMRLGRIEASVSRVRLQIWLLLSVCLAMFGFDLIGMIFQGV